MTNLRKAANASKRPTAVPNGVRASIAQLRGWSPFTGFKVEYSLIERTVERELVPMAKALNLGFTAWSPLAGGS